MADQLTEEMDNLNLDEQNRAKFDNLPTRIKERIYNESFGMLDESKLEIEDLQAQRRQQVNKVVSQTEEAMHMYNRALRPRRFPMEVFIADAQWHYALANEARENVNELTQNINRISQLYYFHDMNQRYRFDKER